MTSTQKTSSKSQTAKPATGQEEAIGMIAGWLDIDPSQLDKPENAITKTIVHLYAEKMLAGGDKQKLKEEFLALFNNSPGMHAVELAQRASTGAGELARNTGRTVGQNLKDEMRTEFNIGLREGMASDSSTTPDPIALGKAQVETYFARLDKAKEQKRLT